QNGHDRYCFQHNTSCSQGKLARCRRGTDHGRREARRRRRRLALPTVSTGRLPPGNDSWKLSESGMVTAASLKGLLLNTRGSGFYYGWVIAITSGVILVVTNGMTLAGLNVFDKPLLAALADSTGEPVPLAALKVRDTITLLVSGLVA